MHGGREGRCIVVERAGAWWQRGQVHSGREGRCMVVERAGAWW